jgi:hypothetical protein
VGFSDRLRAWLRGESKRRAPSPSTDTASRAAVKELEAFVRSRIGVEAYVEPKTAIYSTTIVLVADDGEYFRRPIKDRDAARRFAAELNIPLYDAAKVGYPRRMRDYDRGQRPRRVDLSELPPWPGDDERGGGPPDGPPPPPPGPPPPSPPPPSPPSSGPPPSGPSPSSSPPPTDPPSGS